MAVAALRGQDFLLLHRRQGGTTLRSRAAQPLAAIADGFVSEEHSVRLSKTAYPVESGGSLVDHAVVQPRTLKLTGWVSDLLAPHGVVGGPERGRDAWDQLTQLMESREPFLVITELEVYPSMLITSLRAPVDRTTGRALRFEIELEEVQFRALRRGQRPAPARIGPAEDRPEEVDLGRRNAPTVAIATPAPVSVPAAVQVISDLQEPGEPEDGGFFSAIGRGIAGYFGFGG